MKKSACCVFFLTALVRPLCAQPQLGLPHIDGVTGFYRAGRLPGEKRISPCRWSTTCGWGFEALYEIGSSMTAEEARSMLEEARSIEREGDGLVREGTALQAEAKAMRDEADTQNGAAAEKAKAAAVQKDAQGEQKTALGQRKIAEASEKRKRAQAQIDRRWYSPNLELAVGYDFLNIDRTATDPKAGSYEILSSVQTLPSISLYSGWVVNAHREESSNVLVRHVPIVDVYVGLATGHVVLKNAKIQDSNGGLYAISPDPDAYPFAWSAGVICCSDPLREKAWPVRFFVEYAHEVRTFPGIGYTYVPNSGKGDVSATLPRTLSVSGNVVNIGFELLFPKSSRAEK